MKKVFLTLGVILAFISCTSNASKQDKDEPQNVFDVPQLLSVAIDSVDKEVTVKGLVTHVCSHSGRRCFLEDSTGEYSVKVEATDTLGTFDRAIMGTEIIVSGILREKRLSAEYINDWEIEIKEKHAHEAEEGGEKCASELANITSMREWMKEHNKDYYSIFYIDGISYTPIED